MNREELVALRDVLDALLRCPDHVRELLVRWLTPEGAKPNGRDPHPPPESLTPANGFNDPPPSGAPKPRSANVERLVEASKAQARNAEERLLAAMRETPSLSVAALAKVANASLSTTGERLKRLAARGAIEKDFDGRWRLAGDEARPMEAPPG